MILETLKTELSRVAEFWLLRAVDEKNGGIFGEMTAAGDAVAGAHKGAVLHLRCLWFFSEMGIYLRDPRFIRAADKLYAYILQHFIDKVDGGVYWSITEKGEPANTRKQTFAQAFYIYGLLSFYKLTQKQEVQKQALEMYELIEEKTFQSHTIFHISAFDNQWYPLSHMGFGEGDIHAVYTLDTELHVMEAYAELHRAAPSEKLASSIRKLLKAFESGFIDRKTGYLYTHLNEHLDSLSPVRLFGHNVECAWLIDDALSALGDKKLHADWIPMLTKILSTLEESGIGQNGRLLEGIHSESGKLLEDSVWWMQCEGVIGMILGYRLTGNIKWKSDYEQLLEFIRVNHIDQESGEWQWFTLNDQLNGKEVGLVNEWKGPYHNGRMLMKAIAFQEAC